MREKLLAYTAENFNTLPEYPWADKADYAVLRHADNQKWFAVLMRVKRSTLKLKGEGLADIMNVKCGPDLSGGLILKAGILPAYHMNKEHWVSVLLDGTVDFKEVTDLLELSFDLTAKKRKILKNPRTGKEEAHD